MNTLWLYFFCFSAYLASSGVSGGRWRIRKDSSKCKADANEPWSYRGKNGPSYWGETFPTCKGHRQSPIAINSDSLVFDKTLEMLKMHNYDIPITRGTIENDGRTVIVSATDGVMRTIYVKDDIYALTQLHFHWGDVYNKGSEHKIDGVQYAMEMHLVHENSDNQIAVVSVLFEEQKVECPELQAIIDHFPKVLFKDMRTQLKFPLTINNLLPANPATFYRYTGSLTTPPCSEDVTWSILAMTKPVGFHQMDEFRKLYSAPKPDASWKCKLANNFRPIQALNKRKVFISH